jgi:hypothetical protein
MANPKRQTHREMRDEAVKRLSLHMNAHKENQPEFSPYYHSRNISEVIAGERQWVLDLLR